MTMFSPLSTVMVLLVCMLPISINAQSPPNTTHQQTDFIEVLVKFKAGVAPAAKETLIENTNVVVRKEFKHSDTELWRVPVIANTVDNIHSGTAAITTSVNGHPDIQYIEPNYAIKIFGQPDDPYFNQLWALENSGQLSGLSGADIDAINAWEVSTGSAEAVVGVLDTGIDWSHEDLAENIWQNLAEDIDGDGKVIVWSNNQWIFDPDDENGIDDDGNGYVDDFIGWDFINNDNNPFDDHGHGTHVAGTIGARGNNGVGITGVAWEVRLMPLKIFDNAGSGTVSMAKEALEYALNMGAQLTNHSWGTLDYSIAFLETLETALDSEHLIIAAAGNTDLNNDLFPVFPASYHLENIIAVTATDRQDGFTTFSNYGENFVDIGAPGESIYSTLPGNFYGTYSGTSMAAPQVAGTLALAWGICHNYTGLELKTHLLNSAAPNNSLLGKCKVGGRLNAGDFINSLATPNLSFTHLPFDTLKVEFSTSIATQTNYYWDFGDGTSESTTTGKTSHIYNESGNYTVCLSMTDDCGVQHMTCKDIYVSVGNIPADCTPGWTQFTDGDYILTLAEEENYIWAGSSGGLVKVNKADNSYYFYSSFNSDLPHNHINSIAIDPNGVKWIGTDKGGLARFDGSFWQVFNTENSGLPHNNIQAVTIDDSGQIWIATKGGGLAVFDGDANWEVYNAQNSNLPTDVLSDVLIVSPSEIYVSTSYLGVVELIAGTWWNTGSGLPGNTIHDLAYDAQSGEFWIATNNGLAYRTAANNWIVYTETNSQLRGNNILTVEVNQATGMKWIGTWGGVHQFDGTTWIIDDNYSSGGMLVSNAVNAVLLSTNGSAWMGTNRSLTQLENGNWSNMTGLNTPLPDNRINEIVEDRDGNMWIATESYLGRMVGNDWHIYSPENSPLPSETIYTLFADDDKVWVGLYGGLVEINIDQLSGTGMLNWDTYTSEFTGEMVWTMAKDSTGNLWVGTYGDGLAVYDGISWTTYDTNNSVLPNNTVRKIIFDENDNSIWVATEGGAVKIDDTGWAVHDAGTGIPGAAVYDIDIDGNGLKWFTFWNNTIATYNDTDWTVEDNLTAGLTGQVELLCIDNNNEKLLGTTHGICKIGEEGAIAYTVGNTGLPDNEIRAITVDASGNRWFGTDGGLGMQAELIASFAYEKQAPCIGNTVTFMNTSGNPYNQRWYVNGTLVGQTDLLNYTFPGKGTYDVRLQVENDDNCTASFTEEITIGDRATDLSLYPFINVCDDYVELKSGLENLKTYLWYKDGAVVGNTDTYKAKEAGTYIIKIVDWCGEQAEDTIQVMLESDCVWPGDTNDDGQVDMKDVLPVGRWLGLNTMPRGTATSYWEGQAAPLDSLGNADSYADADGDGLIDNADAQIVENNYGNVHGDILPATPLPTTPLASLRPVLDSTSIFNGDDSLKFDIVLMNEDSIPLVSYGLAYTFKHGSSFAAVDFSNAWLKGDNDAELLTLAVNYPGQHTDVAITRVGQLDFEGYGTTSSIITVHDLPTGGPASINYTYNFSLENILLVDSDGNEIPVKGYDLTLIRSMDNPIAVVVENTNATCLTGGRAEAIAYGGTAPYTYLWETGEQTQSISGLSPGIHYVTVTDADGIIQIGEGRIVDDYSISLFTNSQPETNDMSNGMASVTTSGGSGYSYLWNTGQTTATITGLTAGSYTVTVSDNTGCQAIEQVIVAGDLYVKLKVLLEGPYNDENGLMNSFLQERGILPFGSPYETGEMTTINTLNSIVDVDDVVDWVIVELRAAQDTSLLTRRAALLQRDGDVTDMDGEPIKFEQMPADDYYIAIRHRNHLSMISATPLPLDRAVSDYEFLTPASVMALPFGLRLLDANTNTYGLYTGNIPMELFENSEDINGYDKGIWAELNGVFGQYLAPDFNLDGDINGGDKAKWEENNGFFNELPE